MKFFISYIFLAFISFIIVSCGNDSPVNNMANETVLYEEPGLVDSVIVTGCYAYTRSHFLADTFSFNTYSKVRVEFESFSTSDHATVSVLSNNSVITNEVLYTRNNEDVNMRHSFEIPSPGDSVWLELRLYMNPQVCGENEFKYIRARDLKITGIE